MQHQATNLQNNKHHVKDSDSSLTLVDSSVLPSQISLNPSTVTTIATKRSKYQNDNSFESENENDKIDIDKIDNYSQAEEPQFIEEKKIVSEKAESQINYNLPESEISFESTVKISPNSLNLLAVENNNNKEENKTEISFESTIEVSPNSVTKIIQNNDKAYNNNDTNLNIEKIESDHEVSKKSLPHSQTIASLQSLPITIKGDLEISNEMDETQRQSQISLPETIEKNTNNGIIINDDNRLLAINQHNILEKEQTMLASLKSLPMTVKNSKSNLKSDSSETTEQNQSQISLPITEQNSTAPTTLLDVVMDSIIHENLIKETLGKENDTIHGSLQTLPITLTTANSLITLTENKNSQLSLSESEKTVESLETKEIESQISLPATADNDKDESLSVKTIENEQEPLTTEKIKAPSNFLDVVLDSIIHKNLGEQEKKSEKDHETIHGSLQTLPETIPEIEDQTLHFTEITQKPVEKLEDTNEQSISSTASEKKFIPKTEDSTVKNIISNETQIEIDHLGNKNEIVDKGYKKKSDSSQEKINNNSDENKEYDSKQMLENHRGVDDDDKTTTQQKINEATTETEEIIKNQQSTQNQQSQDTQILESNQEINKTALVTDNTNICVNFASQKTSSDPSQQSIIQQDSAEAENNIQNILDKVLKQDDLESRQQHSLESLLIASKKDRGISSLISSSNEQSLISLPGSRNTMTDNSSQRTVTQMSADSQSQSTLFLSCNQSLATLQEFNDSDNVEVSCDQNQDHQKQVNFTANSSILGSLASLPQSQICTTGSSASVSTLENTPESSGSVSNSTPTALSPSQNLQAFQKINHNILPFPDALDAKRNSVAMTQPVKIERPHNISLPASSQTGFSEIYHDAKSQFSAISSEQLKASQISLMTSVLTANDRQLRRVK